MAPNVNLRRLAAASRLPHRPHRSLHGLRGFCLGAPCRRPSSELLHWVCATERHPGPYGLAPQRPLSLTFLASKDRCSSPHASWYCKALASASRLSSPLPIVLGAFCRGGTRSWAAFTLLPRRPQRLFPANRRAPRRFDGRRRGCSTPAGRPASVALIFARCQLRVPADRSWQVYSPQLGRAQPHDRP